MAVLTYLRRILESLDHPDMINLILHYLLALPDSLPRELGSRSSVSDARKRKSMDLASMLAEKSDVTATPLLFNLVDLILACLRSQNQQTIHVTLQLVSAILKRHHRYAVITLLRTEILPPNNFRRTIGAHEQEVEYVMSLAGSIGGLANFDEIYQTVLRDTMTRLENHPCSIKLVAPRVSTSNQRLPDSLPGAPRDVTEHTLRPDDPLLNSLLNLLETFFINPVETNLSVTETLVDLAVCGFMRIEGWLARNPNTYTFAEDEAEAQPAPIDEEQGEQGEQGEQEEQEEQEKKQEAPEAEKPEDPHPEELEQVKAMKKCRRWPQWSQSSVPRVLDVLKHLEEQVLTYKKTIPRFDELVQQRREAFQTADAMLHTPQATNTATPMMQDTPVLRSSDEISRSASPSRPSALEGLAHRLLSELGTPSRSSSPRGRKELNRSSASGSASPSLKATLSPRPDLSHPRGDRNAVRSVSPAKTRDESSHRPKDEVVASQLAAFAAIDQTILARKVGLLDKKIEPIPLKFDKEPIPEPVDETQEPEQATEDESEVDKPESSEDQVVTSTDGGTVSVSHVITNTIILQSFCFELASLLQVRAGLFNEKEVRFV